MLNKSSLAMQSVIMAAVKVVLIKLDGDLWGSFTEEKQNRKLKEKGNKQEM